MPDTKEIVVDLEVTHRQHGSHNDTDDKIPMKKKFIEKVSEALHLGIKVTLN